MNSNQNQNIFPLSKLESPLSLTSKSQENQRRTSKSPFLKLQKEESKNNSFRQTKKLEIFTNNLLIEKEDHNFEMSPMTNSKIIISRDPTKSFNALPDNFLKWDFESFVIFSKTPSHHENIRPHSQKKSQKTCESLNEIEKSDEIKFNNDTDLKKITLASIGEFCHHRHNKRKITKEIIESSLYFEKMKCFKNYFAHNNVEDVVNSLINTQYSSEKINAKKKKKFLMRKIHQSKKIQPLSKGKKQ